MHHSDSNNMGTIGLGSIPRSAKKRIFDVYDDVHETTFDVDWGTNWSVNNGELRFDDTIRVGVGRPPYR